MLNSPDDDPPTSGDSSAGGAGSGVSASGGQDAPPLGGRDPRGVAPEPGVNYINVTPQEKEAIERVCLQSCKCEKC